MARVHLPEDAKAGPTKAEVRSVLMGKLCLDGTDHFVEVGSCTGAVTVEAARRAGRVTALERKPERLATTETNLAANDTSASVELREGEAPDGLPADADALFLGGSRNYEQVLDWALDAGVDHVVMNVSRLEVAGEATRAFRDRDLLDEVVQFQVSHGYELAGATSFDSQNPVYMLVGGARAATDGGRWTDKPASADGGRRTDEPSSADGGRRLSKPSSADGGQR